MRDSPPEVAPQFPLAEERVVRQLALPREDDGLHTCDAVADHEPRPAGTDEVRGSSRLGVRVPAAMYDMTSISHDRQHKFGAGLIDRNAEERGEDAAASGAMFIASS